MLKKHIRAGHGEHGSKSRSTGADGADVYVDVPLGTVIRDTETNNILFEITEDGEETGAIDIMHYFWNDNRHPDNRAPVLQTPLQLLRANSDFRSSGDQRLKRNGTKLRAFL